MQDLVQLLVNGVALGSVYALAALGFVLVYSSTGIVNFAAGQFVMLGALLGVTTILQLGLPMPLALLLAVAMMGVFGFLFYFGVHLPLRSQPAVTVVIATVMIGLSMQNGANLIWGSLPFRLPSPFGDGTLNLEGSAITIHAVASIGITALLIVALHLLMHFSSIGRVMRAVAQDLPTARLMGLPVGLLLACSWAIAAVLAGFAGLLIGPMWFADAHMGDAIALKAFAATIIGGFGSVPGAIAGGLFVGLAEILGASYISSAYKDLLCFGAMVMFLVARPQGIFGEPVSERG
jgi:branched-chain amino acid transport system permease protein